MLLPCGSAWGHIFERRIGLYHSWLVYEAREVRITTLMKGVGYWFCVDSFNENGITEGEAFWLPA